MLNQYDIEEEFKDIVDDATQDRSLEEYLQEVLNYGQNEFCYYSDTTNLYDEYKSDCDDWLYNLVEETGMEPWNLFSEWDYAPDSEQNKSTVIATMFENYCRDRLEKMEDQLYNYKKS